MANLPEIQVENTKIIFNEYINSIDTKNLTKADVIQILTKYDDSNKLQIFNDYMRENLEKAHYINKQATAKTEQERKENLRQRLQAKLAQNKK